MTIMEIDVKFWGVIRKALETLQVKAALDGKPATVVATQEALEALGAERVPALEEITREELTDIESALALYIADAYTDLTPSRAAIRVRMEKVLVKVSAAIKLYAVTKH